MPNPNSSISCKGENKIYLYSFIWLIAARNNKKYTIRQSYIAEYLPISFISLLTLSFSLLLRSKRRIYHLYKRILYVPTYVFFFVVVLVARGKGNVYRESFTFPLGFIIRMLAYAPHQMIPFPMLDHSPNAPTRIITVYV